MAADWNRYLAQAERRRSRIIALHRGGKTVEWLAKRFDVSKPRIHQIINAKRRP